MAPPVNQTAPKADGPRTGPRPPAEAPLPATIELSSASGRATLRIDGDLTIEGIAPLWDRLDAAVGGVEPPVAVDVSGVRRCDSAGVAMIVEIRERLGEISIVGANEQVAAALRLAERVAPPPEAPEPPPSAGFLHDAGHWAHVHFETVRATFGYIGDLAASLAQAVRHPHQVRWRDTVEYMVRTGSDAIGIVALIGFLIGWILAFQGAAQLGKFGAESYTADAVGVGIVMELGPLMTAIIVAGRSGAAFAAEIATMKVNEEVDALDTMGLDRTRFLVTPKVIALLLMMPLLVVFADAFGIMGGMLIGTTSLGMSIETYLRRTAESVDLRAFAQGMIKGEAYAIVIAAIGCLRGLQTKQGAQGVGLATTSAVVTAILYIILVDAALTTVFQYVW